MSTLVGSTLGLCFRIKFTRERGARGVDMNFPPKVIIQNRGFLTHAIVAGHYKLISQKALWI